MASKLREIMEIGNSPEYRLSMFRFQFPLADSMDTQRYSSRRSVQVGSQADLCEFRIRPLLKVFIILFKAGIFHPSCIEAVTFVENPLPIPPSGAPAVTPELLPRPCFALPRLPACSDNLVSAVGERTLRLY